MRLFFAVEMPAPVQAALSALLDRLRRRADGVRWVDPQGMHLTLRFLGEVGPERVAPIVSAARAAVGGHARVRLRTGGLGTFPERGRPRVAWVAVLDETGALAELQMALQSALEPVGFPRDRRPFSPHLTLGRVGAGADPRRALSQVSAPEPMAFEVSELVLLESLLGQGPARYEARARFPLGGGGESSGAT